LTVWIKGIADIPPSGGEAARRSNNASLPQEIGATEEVKPLLSQYSILNSHFIQMFFDQRYSPHALES